MRWIPVNRRELLAFDLFKEAETHPGSARHRLHDLTSLRLVDGSKTTRFMSQFYLADARGLNGRSNQTTHR